MKIAVWLRLLSSAVFVTCLGILAYVNWWAAYAPGPASVARRSQFWVVGDVYASLALTICILFVVSRFRGLRILDYIWIPAIAFIFVFVIQALSRRQS